jgi:hypothetical protein
VEEQLFNLDFHSAWWNDWPPFESTTKRLIRAVRERCSSARILDRLQSLLADKLQGWKE